MTKMNLTSDFPEAVFQEGTDELLSRVHKEEVLRSFIHIARTVDKREIKIYARI